MAISVTLISSNNNAVGATISNSVPAGGVPAGALSVTAIMENKNSAPAGSVTDTASNTYIAAVGANPNAATANGFVRIFYAWNVAALVSGNLITYNKVTSGDEANISSIYATGIQNSSDPLDSAASATATGSSSTPSVTSGTPAASGDLFVGTAGLKTNTVFFSTDASGWTSIANEANANIVNVFSYQINAGSGTKTYNPVFDGSAPWAALICAFKAANNQPPYQPWAQRGPMLAS
jgi:hypothetical protein